MLAEKVNVPSPSLIWANSLVSGDDFSDTAPSTPVSKMISSLPEESPFHPVKLSALFMR